MSFTPYASAAPCSARCVFCSETLLHKDSRLLSGSLRPGPRYHEELALALRALEGLPLDYSLSGLESTDDPAWLLATLEVLEAHASRSEVGQQVLYTSAAGLADEGAGPRLIDALARFGLSRLEISRHAVEAAANQSIMRFNEGVAVATQGRFERTVRRVAGALPTRLVCVVQVGGVATLDEARRYLGWARSLGVDQVVFRELARTGADYPDSPALALLEGRRVELTELLPRERDGDFQLLAETEGYYWRSRTYRFDGGAVWVSFEDSDYALMKERHHSSVVHKLVFHANGRLCADWDPEREVLLDLRDVAAPDR
ncbi:MAG: hypothetical protein IT382_11915 [Deltaproteobacteria bacterium]|nr:hypothetical protein [Deltaproteobacteria bacterium]